MKTQTPTHKYILALAACLLSVMTARPAAITQNSGDNYIAWEAESQVTINNGSALAKWAVVSDGRASGGSTLMEQGASDSGNAASTAAWTLVFQSAGTYQLYVKYMLDPCCGANSYKFPNAFGAFDPANSAWKVSSANENGAGPTSYTVVREREQNTQNFGTFTVAPGDVGVPKTFMIANREAPGLRIDRIVLSQDLTLADNGGAGFNALLNSGDPFGFGPQPADATALVGGSATFTAVASHGTGPYTYQWLTNGVVDPSATGSSYTISGITTSDARRTFQAVATDATSATATSRAAKLTVANPVGSVAVSYTGRYDPGVTPPGCCQPASILAPTDVAGLVPVANWNNIDNSSVFNGVTPGLTDVSGAATLVTLNYDANDSWNNDAATFTTGDEKMFKGISKANGANRQNTYTFGGLPDGNYDLFVYLNVNGDGRIGDITAGGNTYVASGNTIYFNSQHTFAGSFIQSSSTNPNERGGGNYVRYSSIVPDSSHSIPIAFINRGDADGIGIAGFELLSTGLEPISITTQPASTVVGAGTPFSFSVAVSGSGPRTVQWYTNGVAIPGANALSYSGTATLAMNGTVFSVNVANGIPSSVRSADATLTVAAVPVLVSAGSLDSLTSVCLRFTKALDNDSLNTSHYGISGGVTVNSAAFAPSDPTVVILQTSPLTAGTTYTLTVTGVHDTDSPAHVIFPNPSTANFTPGGYEQIRLTYRRYESLNSGQSQAVSVLTGSPKYPNSPDFVAYNGNNAVNPPSPPLMEFPQTSRTPEGDKADFGGVLSGLYVAPLSGNYQFAIAADDNAQLWISTDADPGHKVMVATQPDWSDERNYITRSDGRSFASTLRPSGYDTISANIPMIAGNQYYIEALYKEGGGGDHCEVAVRRPGDAAIANGTAGIPLDQFAPDPSKAGLVYYRAGNVTFTPGPVTITSQPADSHVVEGQTVSFSVNFSGTPPFTVQWYKNGTAIPGGTGKTVSFDAAAADNNAVVKAVVQNQCSAATSRDAAMQVDVDTIKPTVADAGCDAADKIIRVLFSETVLGAGGGDRSATNTINYGIDGGLVIVGAAVLSDNKTVLLTANDVLTPNQAYTLTIANIQDRSVAGNVMDPVSLPVTGCICTNGVVMAEMWRGNSGPNNFQTLTNNPKFPNSPDNIYFLNSPNWAQTPNAYWLNQEENYGLRMKGWIVPSISGNYTFQVHADDSLFLAVSTDGNPANLRQLLNDQGDCGGVGCAEQTTGNVPLVAGQSYYFEAMFQEGGGGDYLELRWTPPGVAKQFIPAANLRFCVDPQKVPLEVTGPNDVTVEECGNATFTVSVNAPNQGPISYQWLKEDFAIDGATGPSYTVRNAQGADSALGSDEGYYSCRVTVLLREAVSQSALLTVTSDTTPPTLIGAVGDDTFHHVILSFSEPMNPQTATDPTLYTVCSADVCTTLDPATPPRLVNGTNVVLTTFDPLSEGVLYTATVVGTPLYDSCASDTHNNQNFVAQGSFAQFHAWAFIPCLVKFETYEAGNGANVSDLTGSPVYPNSPRVMENGKTAYYISAVNSRLAYPDDSHEAYGARMSGWFTAPADGNYQFAIASDDGGAFYLSTDASPANKVSIATMPEWTGDLQYVERDPGGANDRIWTTTVSTPVTLAAGNRYYFEALYKEGGGGDHCEVTVRLPGGPAIANGQAPMGPEFVGTIANPDTITTLPTSGKLAPGSLTARGFDVRMVQVTTNIDNLLSIAELMLAGSAGPNVAKAPSFVEPGIINYSIETSSYGNIPNDAPFPGIPGSSLSTDNIAMEAVTYLELRAGYHCMIVNSDDGFRVTPALCAADPNNAIVLGSFDGGRGASDSPFLFSVPEDGLYPIRLIWQQGGGGANVEFVDIQEGNVAVTGSARVAVNGNNSIRAFRPSGQFQAVQVGNKLHITWPSDAPCHNWRLQSTGELANPSSATVWTDVPGVSPQDVDITPGNKFFRLISP